MRVFTLFEDVSIIHVAKQKWIFIWNKVIYLLDIVLVNASLNMIIYSKNKTIFYYNEYIHIAIWDINS